MGRSNTYLDKQQHRHLCLRSPRSRLRRRQALHGADRCHDPRHPLSQRAHRAKNSYSSLAGSREELCHQGSPFLSHALRQLSSTPLPARQGGPGDNGYVPFNHLCPDGRGRLPQADPPGSSHHRLERTRGGPVDGRPHGIQMTPTGGGPKYQQDSPSPRAGH